MGTEAGTMFSTTRKEDGEMEGIFIAVAATLAVFGAMLAFIFLKEHKTFPGK
jgi:hypothetical protein